MIANAQQRKKTFQTNIFKFFLERASISNFCCATNQNNPRKYVSYNRSHLLQPCGKFLSWASPIPLGNFYPLAPPHPLGISINHPWGGGMDIFWNHTMRARSGVKQFNSVALRLSSFVFQLICACYPVRSRYRDSAVVRALACHQCGPGSIPRLCVMNNVGCVCF